MVTTTVEVAGAVSEWMVVGVIVVLLGFVTAIVTPVVKLTITITKLDTTVGGLSSRFDEFAERNSKAHDALFGAHRENTGRFAKLDARIDRHGDLIADNTRRLTEHSERLRRVEARE